MNFKIIFIISVLQLAYTALAGLEFIGENIILPTKLKTKEVDSMTYEKRVVNDSEKLTLKFTYSAKHNIYEEDQKYYYNGEPIDFKARKDIEKAENGSQGKKFFYLNFHKFTEKIAGQYMMIIKITNGSVLNVTSNIYSPPFIHEFTESKRSTEGGRIDALCKYTAFPMELTELSWKSVLNRDKINYRLVKSQNTSAFSDMIIWDYLEKQDAGFYKCEVKNAYGNDTVILRLRVKDKLAPLWPFIGIVIEIVILLLIIIFYERQKSSKKTAEQESNPTRQSLLADVKNSEVNEGVHHRNPAN